MERISGELNKKQTIEFNDEEEQLNVYDLQEGRTDVPEGINDFYITIVDDIGYVETRQKWGYDQETGCLYFIEEVK